MSFIGTRCWDSSRWDTTSNPDIEMRRTITEIVEDYLADYLLRHDVKRGETIAITKDDLHW